MSTPKSPYSHSDIDGRTFYHGTKAELEVGDELSDGYSSNYTERSSPWIYFSKTVRKSGGFLIFAYVMHELPGIPALVRLNQLGLRDDK